MHFGEMETDIFEIVSTTSTCNKDSLNSFMIELRFFAVWS
jgi:hypothetical protein